MNEIWLPVVGYEGFYEVSNLGRVRTVARRVVSKAGSTRLISARIRKPVFIRAYPAVNLCMLGKTKMRTIHVMVAEAFLGPRPSERHDCCHWDDVPANNILTNLRWATKSENCDDAFRNDKKPHGVKSWKAKLSEAQVHSIYADQRDHMLIAREHGIERYQVRRIKSGKTWARTTGHQKPPVALPGLA